MKSLQELLAGWLAQLLAYLRSYEFCWTPCLKGVKLMFLEKILKNTADSDVCRDYLGIMAFIMRW